MQVPRTVNDLTELYLTDETGWLEQMSALAKAGDVETLDLDNLSEYLAEMAKRDKREVMRRLIVLLAHLLKWDFQPEKRSRGWELTIREQREELQSLLESGTLMNFAEQEFAEAYRRAVRRAAVEADLAEDVFPPSPSYTLASLIGV